jgi:hypothetical protein
MPVNLQFNNGVSLNTRVYFSNSGSEGAAVADGGGAPITLRRPTTGETFVRRLLNTLTFGRWTRHVENPKQWNAFKAAVALRMGSDPRLDDWEGGDVIDKAFSTYSSNQRLTRSKAHAILGEIEKVWASGNKWNLKSLPANGVTNLSQSLVLRGAHTLSQKLSGRQNNNQIGALDRELGEFRKELVGMESRKKLQSKPDGGQVEGTVVDSEDEFAIDQDVLDIDNLKKDIAQTQAILALGGGAGGGVVDLGLRALYKEHDNYGSDRFFLNPGISAMESVEQERTTTQGVLATAQDKLVNNPDVQAQLQKPHQTSIVAIPLSLMGKKISLHENHSVLLALDLKNKQVLYLDAKGESPRAAERNYANAQGLQKSIEDMGSAVFGEDWKPNTGVQMLSNAKQQGANDCFAFTHDFTRRLVEGQSLVEIDRQMDEALRDGVSREIKPGEAAGSQKGDGIRARMARDIIKRIIEPKLESLRASIGVEPDASDTGSQEDGYFQDDERKVDQ